MNPWNYLGVNDQLCQCEYVQGTVNGNEVLVIKQLSGTSTSITNVIEYIVSGLLAGPLHGIDATKLRVFEFYSPTLAPSVTWQEVEFDIAKRQPRMTVLENLKEIFGPTDQPYVVWNPQWNPISYALQLQLVQLDPIGLV